MISVVSSLGVAWLRGSGSEVSLEIAVKMSAGAADIWRHDWGWRLCSQMAYSLGCGQKAHSCLSHGPLHMIIWVTSWRGIWLPSVQVMRERSLLWLSFRNDTLSLSLFQLVRIKSLSPSQMCKGKGIKIYLLKEEYQRIWTTVVQNRDIED